MNTTTTTTITITTETLPSTTCTAVHTESSQPPYYTL
jgi:hypothetical protein